MARREAVIVSSARTPIGKAYRGAFNNLEAPALAAPAVQAAIARASVEGAEVEDVIFGSALTQGSSGVNVARHIAQAAGLPDIVAGATIDRQCASGLNALTMASHLVTQEGADIVLARRRGEHFLGPKRSLERPSIPCAKCARRILSLNARNCRDCCRTLRRHPRDARRICARKPAPDSARARTRIVC